MSLRVRDLCKKSLLFGLNIFIRFYTCLSTIIHTLLNWTPTSNQLLAESEENLLKFLKNKPDRYYVEIGPGFSNNSNKIWTYDFNVKNLNDTSTRPVYKRKSLINQSFKIKNRETPVLFLHGLASGSAIWLLNFDQIFENGPRRLFAIDILGFGRSSKPNFDFSTEVEWDLVHSIERWRRAIGLEEKFIIIGHEFGAYLGLCYAFHFPDLVSHVVLCDAYGIPSQQGALQFRTTSQYPLPFWVKFLNKYLLGKSLSPFGFLRILGPYGYNIFKTTRSDILDKYKKILKEENAELMLNYLYHINVQPKRSGEIAFKALSLPNGWSKYPLIHRMKDLSPDINMTFIFGSRSWVDRQPAFQVKYLLGESRVSVNVIQGAGHLPYADNPDEFNNLIIQLCNIVDEYNESPNQSFDIPEVSSLLQDE